MSARPKHYKVRAFNDFLSKILDFVCIFWAMLWIGAGVIWVSQGYTIALVNVFLYGSPAVVYLVYRYMHYYKDKWASKKANNEIV